MQDIRYLPIWYKNKKWECYLPDNNKSKWKWKHLFRTPVHFCFQGKSPHNIRSYHIFRFAMIPKSAINRTSFPMKFPKTKSSGLYKDVKFIVLINCMLIIVTRALFQWICLLICNCCHLISKTIPIKSWETN